MTDVLVVAAEPWELAHVPARFRTLTIGIGNRPTMLPAADVVVSAGVCGALAPELQIADVVVATHVNGTEVAQPSSFPDAHRGPVLSVDRIVDRAAEKDRLYRETHAVAVEMEAASVLSLTRGRFCCIKSVSDTAEESIHVDLGGAGGYSIARIASQAAQRPFTVIPELIRLYRNSRRAAKALGDFIANCRF